MKQSLQTWRNWMMGRAAIPALLIATLIAATPASAAEACKLLTAAELEPVAGKLSPFKSNLAIPDAQMCTAKGPKGTVMLRWARRKKDQKAGSAETQSVEVAREMGAKVEVKKFGPITCSTFIPPQSMKQAAPNTTCSVTKGDEVAAVEITARNPKDMVSIDRLRPLAEKLAARF